MNTDCLLILYAGEKREREGWAALLRASIRIAEYQRRFSRFQANSDLSRLNDSALDHVRSGGELAALLARALDYARITRGVFDPLVLGDLEALGYDRTFEEVSGRPHARRPRRRCMPSWTSVRVDTNFGTVTRPPGARLDLGGVAKGAAADAAMAELEGFPGALVDLGGDICVRGRPDDADGWILGVEDPRLPDGADICQLQLRDAAVATSSTRRRRWTYGTRVVHHVIDPETGEPASRGVLQCTAIAGAAEHADVAAKVGLILGAGALHEEDEVGRALGLRGIAWVTADGSFHCTGGWRVHALDC